MNYTTNLISNPSFEVSTAGYTQLTGTLIVRDTTTAALGSSSLKVTTDGITAGEGFSSPTAVVPTTCTGSASLYLMGQAGTVSVSAVTAGGVVLSSIAVTLTGTFTRYALNGLVITGTNVPVTIIVQTPAAQKLTFWADSLQVEPESPSTAYCDGDQAGCTWNGTAGLSTSFRQFQFGLSSTAGSTVSGRVAVIVPGEVFTTDPEVTVVQVSGTITVTVSSPVAVFDDFAIFTLTDNDPAMTYALWNNSGIMTGYNNYNQGYMYVTPPLDYPVSGGQFAWRRAAFAAVGYEFVNLASGAAANLTNVQVELPQINGAAAVTPRAWQTPRVINTIVKPNRLNYVANPSFETNISGWSAAGASTSVAADATVFTPDVGVYGNLLYNAGAVSLKTTITASGTGQGCQTTVSNLIIGRDYIASAYVMPDTGIADVELSIANGNGSASQAGTPYGGGTFGGGFYGGLPATLSQLPVSKWYRAACIFTATSESHTLSLTALAITGAAYPTHFWTDAVLVEDGEVLQPYFDGSFGADAFWEGGVDLSTSSNLFTFDAGTGPWGAINGAVMGTDSVNWAYQGTTSVTWHGDGTTANPGIQSGHIFPVIAGDSYTASAWFYTLSTGPFTGETYDVDIQWLNSSGSLISTSSATAAIVQQSATRVSVTATAPSLAVTANIILRIAGTAPAAGKVFQADEVNLIPGSTVGGRSYYYSQFAAKEHMVSDVLTKNCPLGILFSAPQFGVPFSQ